MFAAGIPPKGIVEKLKLQAFPGAIVKYLFCSPNFDFNFRCLPSQGGVYGQRWRDFVEFSVIDGKLRNILARRGEGK